MEVLHQVTNSSISKTIWSSVKHDKASLVAAVVPLNSTLSLDFILGFVREMKSSYAYHWEKQYGY